KSSHFKQPIQFNKEKMIIYSVTVSIDEKIEKDWLAWMRVKHIPDVMNTGYFVEAHLQRLVEPQPEPGLATFNIQYAVQSEADLEAYQRDHAPALQKEHTDRYKDRFVAFRTILQREDSF
ncbi:MAG: DUF4286 family protein, partial [Bacteroidota bacterium]